MSTKFSFHRGPRIRLAISHNEGIIQRARLEASTRFEVCLNRPSDDLFHWCQCYAHQKEPCSQLPLDFAGVTDFRKHVLNELQHIPFGQSRTYQELAQLCGLEKGARAAGGACGANPFPLLIPCHRILASGGSLGGFSQGLEVKKRLLDFEGISYRSN